MKPAAFDYVRAETVDEALELLAEDDAAPLAGGMSLGPMLNFRMARPALVIDLNHIAELAGTKIGEGTVRTGAMVRQAAALADTKFMAAVPLLAQALPHVGHDQTRSRGTLGGSVAHADPSAEIPLCLVTLDGRVELRSRERTRSVAARDFFEGTLTTGRAEDELIVAIVWPARKPKTGYAFEEIAERSGDFAIAAAAAWVTLDSNGAIEDLALGLGGVEDRPVIADLSGFRGAAPDREFARAAAGHAARSVEPMSDRAAGSDYRRHLAGHLAERALARAAEDVSS